MGLGSRILDLARANLNALLDRAAREQLDDVSEGELEAELQRRKAERVTQEQERQRRIAAEEAAQKRGTARGAKDPRTRGTARRQTEAEVRAARIVVLYAELGVRHGAPMDEVKRAYRALMREHHPDHHAGDPKKQQAASARSATITTAYAELELLLGKKR